MGVAKNILAAPSVFVTSWLLAKKLVRGYTRVMKKALIVIVVVAAILVGGFYALNWYIYNEKQAPVAADYKDAQYMVAGQIVQLKDGVSETPAAPGSASKITTKYFGNEVVADLNADGKDDVAFLLTQETGGSGTFFYVVAAIATDRGYQGGEAMLIGDRIAPQTTEKGPNGTVIVNYAHRAPGEDFSVRPSFGKSLVVKLDPASLQFGEVVQNFEGEADPDVMTLGMKTWVWESALYNDGRTVTPKKVGDFTIAFGEDMRVTVDTDCNSMGGKYSAQGGKLIFGDLISTKMYCEDSQEQVFGELLRDTAGYHFTSRGQLILDLKSDSGSVTFR